MADTSGLEPQEGRQPGLPEREQQSSYSLRRLPARWILLALVCAVVVAAYFAWRSTARGPIWRSSGPARAQPRP